MKYYFLLPDLAAGGAERISITFARLLKRNGIETEFLNLGRPEGVLKTWIEPEFKLTSMGYSRVLTALPALVRFMKAHPNDSFFSSREHTNLIGLIAASITNSKIIVRIPTMPNNNLYSGIQGIKARIIRGINKRYIHTAKAVIAQNNEMRQQLIDYYGLMSDRVVTINNPVDKDFIIKSAEGSDNPFSNNELSFLAAGTVGFAKGFDILIKAWPFVKASVPNAHMYIIGRDDSEYSIQLKKESSQLDDFTFLGFQSNPYPYLKYCDVFVLSSRMEGFPNVVLEAICFNKPIASTKCVDVINEIINNGTNGYTCDIENPEALAKAMIEASSLKNIENKYCLFHKNKLIEVFKKCAT
jgi:glycosyltransferase involved in cell wall biosynthesis